MNDVDTRFPQGSEHGGGARPLYGNVDDQVAHFSPGPRVEDHHHQAEEPVLETALWAGTSPDDGNGMPLYGAGGGHHEEFVARRLDAVEDYYDGHAQEDEYDPEHEYDTRAPKSMKTKLVFAFLGLIFIGFVCLVVYGLFFKGPKNAVEQSAPPPVLLEESTPKPAPVSSDPMSDAAAAKPLPQPQTLPAPQAVAPAPAPLAAPPALPEKPGVAPAQTAPALTRASEAEPQPDQARAISDLVAQVGDMKTAIAAGAKERADLAAELATVKAEVSSLKVGGRADDAAQNAGTRASATVQPRTQKVEPVSKSRSLVTHAEKPSHVAAVAAAASSAPANCVLKGADDGIFEDDKKPVAWIADPHSNGEAYHVGQSAPCVGQISSIAVVGDNWVVVGASGRLTLSAGGRN